MYYYNFCNYRNNCFNKCDFVFDFTPISIPAEADICKSSHLYKVLMCRMEMLRIIGTVQM